MTALEALQADVEQFVCSIMGDHEPRDVRAPKFIRDACFGFGRFHPYECNIIDSPLLQRLRRIHQTALAYFTYPSAQHTRFEHSLGCAVLVERMVKALRETHEIGVEPQRLAELRLAALLHDCGHLPFSHAAEPFLRKTPLYAAAAAENRELFDQVNPHEMLSYLIVKSQRFGDFWKRVAPKYPMKRDDDAKLTDIDLENVANIIIGRVTDPKLMYYTQMIHGPFDADKLDYMLRDALFTGLGLEVDLDRLFYTLKTFEPPAGKAQVLAIELSGVINVEQLAFNKTLLYSSVYHHHKVRATLCYVDALLRSMSQSSVGGPHCQTPADLLATDEVRLLSDDHCSDTAVEEIVTRIRNRDLLKRVLVLSSGSLDEENRLARVKYSEFIEGHDRDSDEAYRLIHDFEIELANQIPGLAPELVYFDVPKVPTLGEAGATTVILGDGSIVSLRDVYPTDYWANAYGQYKHKSYIFGPEKHREALAIAAIPLLEKHFGLKLNSLAIDQAKHRTPIDHSLPPA